MTTMYDLIFDAIAEGINNAENMYDELSHRQANYLKEIVSDYLEYIADQAEETKEIIKDKEMECKESLELSERSI